LVNFIRLAQQLMRQGKTKLLIIEGPAESGLGREVAKALPPGEVILAESVTLSLLAAILERCVSFVGNDSGLAHLAAGLGVPSIVLFGPTLPQHWAPLGRHVVALRNSPGCVACISGSGEHTCLNNISVEEVLQSSPFVSGEWTTKDAMD
jgi:ADP-heptose:LPS heptosyltransferase